MSMILINLILFNKTTALQALEVMEWTSKATDIVECFEIWQNSHHNTVGQCIKTLCPMLDQDISYMGETD